MQTFTKPFAGTFCINSNTIEFDSIYSIYKMLALQLRLNHNLFLKDPQTTELGLKIINRSIDIIDKIGFEAFTFKKLSKEIDSTEASIYRYFENKHKLLLYLITWYWAWTEYVISFETHNLLSAEERLLTALRVITEKKNYDENFPNVDEMALQRIVMAESDKTYLTKQVDENNKEGLFRGYKTLCQVISAFVEEIDPEFPFPNALVSTCLEASHQQIYFAHHLPSLSELRNAPDPYHENFLFLKTLVFNTIKARG